MAVQHGISRIHRHSCRFQIPFNGRQTVMQNNGLRHLSQNSKSGPILTQQDGEQFTFKSVNKLTLAANTTQCRTFSKGKIYQVGRQNTQEAKADEHFPSNEGMNLRLSVENDYLSWMRNSYIMTLGGVSMLHFDLWSAGPVAGAAALLTATLNLCIGSAGYLHNLQSLRRRGCISGVMCRLCQLWTFLHFAFWGMVLMVIFPDFKLIETEVSELEEKNQSK